MASWIAVLIRLENCKGPMGPVMPQDPEPVTGRRPPLPVVPALGAFAPCCVYALAPCGRLQIGRRTGITAYTARAHVDFAV
jgi:hypothetical protein